MYGMHLWIKPSYSTKQFWKNTIVIAIGTKRMLTIT